MKKRLYFTLPDEQSAHVIEKELLLAKVEDQHMHFLAKDGIALKGLHVANLMQRSDLLHGMGLGLVAGGLTGAFAGFLVSLSPELGSIVGMGSVLGLAIVGGLVGTWASGMIAVSLPNTHLKRFQAAIDRGEILLMVDVPARRVKEIKRLMAALHPEANHRGADSHIPVFP